MAGNFQERLSSEWSQFRTRVSDFLDSQEWYQDAKSKWDELDPQSRTYLQVAGVGGGALLFVVLTLSLVWVSSSMKREYNEKVDVLAMIRSASEELQRLRENSAGAAALSDPNGGGEVAWPAYLQSAASQVGLSAEQVSVNGNQPAANSGDLSKETIYEIGLKKVNLKRLVKFAIQLENGSRPVRLRSLSVDTGGDPEGYLNAKMSVSTFTVATK